MIETGHGRFRLLFSVPANIFFCLPFLFCGILSFSSVSWCGLLWHQTQGAVRRWRFAFDGGRWLVAHLSVTCAVTSESLETAELFSTHSHLKFGDKNTRKEKEDCFLPEWHKSFSGDDLVSCWCRHTINFGETISSDEAWDALFAQRSADSMGDSKAWMNYATVYFHSLV